MIIARKDSCIGITLFRWSRYKLELWFVPASYSCEEHTHKDSDGEFFVLYGKNRYIYRKLNIPAGWGCLSEQGYNISGRKYFKWYSVKASIRHGFYPLHGSTLMIFLCWETYKKGVKVTSPAIDFHPVSNI